MASLSTTSAFWQYVENLRAQVDVNLEKYLQFGVDCPAQLADAIRYSSLAPGKRLRPLLLLTAAKTCGSSIELAMPVACAVEMVHCYSLIHDDLPAMDDDDLRRGLPTCHRKFGEANAILAGDALLTSAFEIIADGVRSPEMAVKVTLQLAQAAGASGMVGGQADDLQAEVSGGDLSKLESIHQRKTGAMLRVSLRLGAMIAQAADEQIARLDTYGRKIGLAFQIVDDLLDATGNTATLGKGTRKDAGKGKLTFTTLLGEQQSRVRARLLVEEACDCLQPFGERASHLRSFARFVLDREY